MDHRTSSEIFGEHRCVDGGRGYDDLEVVPDIGDALQETKDEVYVQAPLVGLVHNYAAVLGQVGVELDLLQQYAVCHYLDLGA